MKTIWKWVLGIVLVLVVVGLVAGAVFMIQHRPVFAFQMGNRNFGNGQNQPNMPQQRGFNGPNGQMPAGPNGQGPRGFYGRPGWFGGERSPMGRMGRFGMGFFPFSIGFIFLAGLVKLVALAFLALLVYIGYRFGKRSNNAPAQVAAPAAVVAEHNCPKCDSPVHDDWKYCPTCGKKQ